MILLDTHVMIWLSEGHSRLGKQARRLADRALAEESLVVSAISFWETEMLSRSRRIRLRARVEAYRRELLDLGLQELPVTGEIAIQAAQLETFHADPADRIIAATASVHRATLLTADQRILEWLGPLKKRDASV